MTRAEPGRRPAAARTAAGARRLGVALVLGLLALTLAAVAFGVWGARAAAGAAELPWWLPVAGAGVLALLVSVAALALVVLVPAAEAAPSEEADQARRDLQAIIDSIPSLVSIFDRDLVCRFANRAHLEWLGQDPATLPGRRFVDLVDAETFALVKPSIDEALAGRAATLYRDFPRLGSERPHRVLARYQPEVRDGQVRGVYMLVHDIDDLHRSQQALARERERLANLLLGTGAETWEWDVASGRITVSGSMWRYVGQERSGEGAITVEERQARTHPDDRAEVRRRLAAHLRGDTPLYEVECRLRDHAGRWVWVRDSGRVSQRDASGQALVMHGTMIDITESMRERERLANIVLGTGAGTWEWDISADQAWVNERFAEIVDVTAGDQAHGAVQLRRSVAHPDEYDEFARRMKAHLAGATPSYSFECRLRGRDGGWTWVLDIGRVSERDGDGRALRMSGIVIDVSERRRAQERLEESERRFRLFADNVDELVVVSEAGVIVDASANWERLIGGRTADAIGRSIFDSVAPKDREPARRRVAAGSEEPYELEVLRADGSRFPALVRGRNVTVGGRPARLTTVLDITRQKHTEAALMAARAEAERASQAKSQFLANMSHEIRTPLNAVIGLAWLFEDTALDDTQRALVSRIQYAGRTLLALVNDVLDLSKIEAGEMALDEEPVALQPLLGGVQRLLSAQADAKGLALECTLATDLPTHVIGDEARLRQILLNLAGNAIKFTERGSVAMRARRVAGAAPAPDRPDVPARLRLEVVDTGIGVAPDALPRLFTPFTQADASSTRRFGGTGLGLSIVRQLAQLMGGTAGATSTPGEGSCFWVELPLRAADGPAAHAHALSVVVAAQAPATRDALVAMARELGWQAQACADAPALAARLAEPPPPDVLLVPASWAGAAPAPWPACVVWIADDPADVALARLRVAPSQPHLDPAALVVRPAPGDAAALVDAVNAACVADPARHDRVLRSTRLAGPGLQWLDGVRLLVADDSDINRDVARHLLQRQGARVATAVDGEDALARLREGRFDAVLMDVQMPVMDGRAATRALRARPDGAGLPVIALTAGALPAERQRALDAGMSDFLSKPLDPDQLVRTIRRHVERAAGRALPVTWRAGRGPAPAAGEAAAPWPAVDGIDAEQVRRRLGGDRALFLRLLRRLLAEFHPWAAPAAGPGAAPDPDAIAARAARLHKLRGASGLIGASAVQRLAGEAEGAVRTADAAALARLESALASALAALAGHSAPWLDADAAAQEDDLQRAAGAAAAPPGAEDGPGTPAVRPSPQALQGLRRALGARDLVALEHAQALAPVLGAWLGAPRARAWRAALDGLDFPAALALLDEAQTGADPPQR